MPRKQHKQKSNERCACGSKKKYKKCCRSKKPDEPFQEITLKQAPRESLVLAVKEGNINVVKSLIASGADVNQVISGKLSPLILASQMGNVDIVNLLIGEGANVNHVTIHSVSSLLVASQAGHDQIVQILIESGADVNIKAEYDQTPLLVASYLGNYECVKLLMPKYTRQDIQLAIQCAQPNQRALRWNYLDDQINEEGRAMCLNLLNREYFEPNLNKNSGTTTKLRF